jgi:hypothetical protein
MVLAQGEGVGLMKPVCVGLLVASLLFAPLVASADTTALILSGVPGSDEHRTRFEDWTSSTRTALVETFGFSESNVVVLADREARADDIRNAFADISGRLEPEDTFFLFFIGHGAFDRSEYKFNIMGADLTATDYAGLLDSLPAGRIVIINGTNSSGASIEALGGENRVVVTATRSGTEQNDPLFYEYFLATLGEVLADEDRNEELSVWEAFRYTTLEVERFYDEEGRLATEHPQISDNGSEQTGVEVEEMPVLSRMINFNQVVEVRVDDPVLQALFDQRRDLESQVEALQLVDGAIPEEEFNNQLEALIIELALTNRAIREYEESQQ